MVVYYNKDTNFEKAAGSKTEDCWKDKTRNPLCEHKQGDSACSDFSIGSVCEVSQQLGNKKWDGMKVFILVLSKANEKQENKHLNVQQTEQDCLVEIGLKY